MSITDAPTDERLDWSVGTSGQRGDGGLVRSVASVLILRGEAAGEVEAKAACFGTFFDPAPETGVNPEQQQQQQPGEAARQAAVCSARQGCFATQPDNPITVLVAEKNALAPEMGERAAFVLR
ncbi:MAG: hypothetical protein BJ554DRAFT_86 [Olpidium bornovanus]|uniref:Uncharacterized protein n=1 Tax=Olpidium bornovanus TaxID=278681 RepID=A0A8H8DID8_9FUNG|nr:MAG: hypothetical protein BJ554DRAFT_86 [Olpidium bornovanus]